MATFEAPEANFSRGIRAVDLSYVEGEEVHGKVRDMKVVDTPRGRVRILGTSDRASAFDSVVCAIPGKGQVLQGMSDFWFARSGDIVDNHVIASPHPNILFAREAAGRIPVEVVLRRYMAESSTSTSIYDNYVRRERRNIYGIDFPDGLRANEAFSLSLGVAGVILTPTTKAEAGEHDAELENDDAREIVDKKLGKGVWDSTTAAAYALFRRAEQHHLANGLILVDTKLEFALDQNGRLMLIDEVFTPDSSRFWLAESYQARFDGGQRPESFDKEILRRWLTGAGFKGNEGQQIPVVDPAVIDQMSAAYRVPYRMVTGPELALANTDPKAIKEVIVNALEKILSTPDYAV